MTAAKTTTLTRTYDAPAALVFECWLKPEHLIHWHSAGEGWTTPHAQSEPREGGRFNIGYQGPETNMKFDFTGVYNEITPPAPGKTGRIVLTIDDGRPVTIEFAADGNKTHLTLILTLENTHSEEQQRHGWGNILENLNRHLQTQV
jgi:uncharacterized protein YndB with AHSA1/START domain